MIDPVVTSETNAEVAPTQARKTALVVAGVLFAIAAWNVYRDRTAVVAIVGGAGISLLLVGLILPGAARRFHLFWMRMASVLGYINSRILLSLLYYGMFFPYGVVSRLFRDPLKRRQARQESYWIQRKATRQTREGFERLF